MSEVNDPIVANDPTEVSPVPSIRKLFHVSATVEVDLLVLAKDEAEAKEIGKANWREELSETGQEPEYMRSREVERKSDIGWVHPDDLQYTSIYVAKGTSAPDEDLDELLEAMGIA